MGYRGYLEVPRVPNAGRKGYLECAFEARGEEPAKGRSQRCENGEVGNVHLRAPCTLLEP
eukprot:1143849-Rhodomonas_salina.2